MKHYLLDEEHNIIEVPDLITWGKAFETLDRKVAKHQVGDVEISTVFLGIDHSFMTGATPILFETMIFGGEHADYQERYATWNEAILGHEKALNMVKK